MYDRPPDEIMENDVLLDDWWDKKLDEDKMKREESKYDIEDAGRNKNKQRREAFRHARKHGQQTSKGSKPVDRQSFTFERS